MITIRNTVYTTEEKQVTADVLNSAYSFLRVKYCPEYKTNCRCCPYRHLCRDLESALKYARGDE